MFTTKVVQCKLLIRDLMHRGAGICHRSDLVCIELLPPVQRSRNIKIHGNHPHEFTMIRTGVAEASHEVKVIGANVSSIWFSGRFKNISTFIIVMATTTILRRWLAETIALIPRVLRIPHSTDGCFPAHNIYVFYFQHCCSPF